MGGGGRQLSPPLKGYKFLMVPKVFNPTILWGGVNKQLPIHNSNPNSIYLWFGEKVNNFSEKKIVKTEKTI